MENNIIKGWGLAIFSVLVLWGLNNVMISYSANVLDVNYLIYTCVAFISASLMLLSIGGLKDDLAKETLRSPDTLLFGLIMLLGYLLTLSLFAYTSATEGAFLQRISMVFSLLVAWFFMQRPPSVVNLIGAIIVLFGIGLICKEIPQETRGIIYLIMFLEGLALTARTFAAETHKTYNKASKKENDPRLKTRVVGFVMFLVSIVFLVFALLFAILQTYYDIFERSSIVPVLSDFYNYKTIFAGLIAGVVLITPLRLIEFYSATSIKSENFLALAALSPFATYFWDWLLSPVTGLDVQTFSKDDLVAGLIITFGCLITAFYQIYRTKKYGVEKWRDFIKEYDEDDIHIAHSVEMIKKALNFFDNNTEKTAEALGISKCTISKLLKENTLFGFRDSVNSIVLGNFRTKVANMDYLTKVTNRSGFEFKAKDLLKDSEVATLMFIDLDRFKPVNDKYGHDAGDIVLKEIANRLKKIENENIIVARYAGDEFIILFINYEKDHLIKHISDFENIISTPVNVSKKVKVQVGASIGVAQYDLDGKSLQELVEYADKRMYSHKKSK